MTPVGLLVLVAGLSLGLLGLALLWRRWPTLALFLLLVGVYTNRYKWEVGPVSIRTEQVIVLLLGGLIALRWAWRGKPIRFPLPGGYAIGWWLALAMATALYAPAPLGVLRHVIRLGLMVGVFFVTVNLLPTSRDWYTLVRGLFFLGLLEGAWGLLARVVYTWDFGTVTLGGYTLTAPLNLGIQVTTSLPVPVPYGTLEEGNIFGSTMGALLLLSLGLWIQPLPPISRRWAAVGVGVTGLAWLLSLARGAWLGVVLVLPLFWVLAPRSGTQRLSHMGVLLVLAPLALAVLAALLIVLPPSSPIIARLQTFTQLSADPTFNLRMERWIDAWNDIRLRPFIGWGPGTFEYLHGIQRFAQAWLDSLTIKVVQESGVLGLLFFYGFWATVVGEGVHALLSDRASPYRGALLGLVGGAAVLFLAYHATDATWLGFMWLWLAALTAHPHSWWVSYEQTSEHTPHTAVRSFQQ